MGIVVVYVYVDYLWNFAFVNLAHNFNSSKFVLEAEASTQNRSIQGL